MTDHDDCDPETGKVREGKMFIIFLIVTIIIITTSNIGLSFISLHDTPRPHTLNRVIRNLMRLAHI